MASRAIILGGFITQTHATAALMFAFVQHPDLQTEVRRNPELIPTLFEEVLRARSPVMLDFRTCTRAADLHGHAFKPGEQVVLNLSAANRDPAEVERPAELDIYRLRNRPPRLAWAASLPRFDPARMTIRVVFEEILSRMENIHGDSPRRNQSPAI